MDYHSLTSEKQQFLDQCQKILCVRGEPGRSTDLVYMDERIVIRANYRGLDLLDLEIEIQPGGRRQHLRNPVVMIEDGECTRWHNKWILVKDHVAILSRPQELG